MTWPAVVLWLLIAFGFGSSGPTSLYLLSISAAFGTLQMIPGASVAGGNVLPQTVCAIAIVGKILAHRGNTIRLIASALDLEQMGFLVAFTIYAVVTAFVLPRLFQNRLSVIPVSGDLGSLSGVEPSFSNFTQSGYLTLSALTAMAVSTVADNEEFRSQFMMASYWTGVVVVLTGILDIASYRFGFSELLAPFRNATYTLLSTAEVLGVKRVVGLMPEASSYGSVCLGPLSILVFLHPCLPMRIRGLRVSLLICALFVMAVLSTSSSAYVGLLVLAACYSANIVLRSARPTLARRRSVGGLLAVATLGIFVMLAFVFDSQLSSTATDLFQNVVLNKSSSESYVQRSSWTAAGWNAFYSTDGLGVGVGSLRVSSWPVSILASTGIVGSVLLLCFLLVVFLGNGRSKSAYDREWRRGLRFCLWPGLIMSGLIGTMPDFGIGAAVIFGLIVGSRNLHSVKLPASRTLETSAPMDSLATAPWGKLAPGSRGAEQDAR